MHGEAVKVRLKAPPVDGAANDELVRFVGARLGIARRHVELLSGATSRTKRLRISGTDLSPAAVRARLLGPEHAG